MSPPEPGEKEKAEKVLSGLALVGLAFAVYMFFLEGAEYELDRQSEKRQRAYRRKHFPGGRRRA